MELLGVDNVFFQVKDLEKAIVFYEKLGFRLKCTISRVASAILNIGSSEPGLILVESKDPKPSRLWVEVPSALSAKEELVDGRILETLTGTTFEIIDPWGNIVGFADYLRKN